MPMFSAWLAGVQRWRRFVGPARTCLRECGLVTATAEGRRVRYELADPRLAEGLRILAGLDLPGTCR